MLTYLKYLISNFMGEKAQDTFEYLIIIGGVCVAVIAAAVIIANPAVSAVVDGVCTAIETKFTDFAMPDCTPTAAS